MHYQVLRRTCAEMKATYNARITSALVALWRKGEHLAVLEIIGTADKSDGLAWQDGIAAQLTEGQEREAYLVFMSTNQGESHALQHPERADVPTRKPTRHPRP